MDYQQPHGYMRPPPPPAADPYQRPPPPLPPPPSNHPWPYPPSQFQYQPQTQHSPSPPSQWPPPHSSDHSQYPPPPSPSYPVHQPPPYAAHPHYPPPHQLPPRPPHLPQSYSQDWGNGSWSHHQSWQYPTPAANNNEEDWAAKARAWAAAKSSTDNQHTQSQFVPAGRPEEQNHFNDQYSQSTDPQFHDVHAQLAPVSNYHQYPVAMGLSNRTGVGQLQDSQYVSSGQSSYTGDAHVPFAARNGSMTADSASQFQSERLPISPLVHQQEVPSSYSSVAGNVEVGDRYEKLNSSSSVPVHSFPQHHVQLPPGGRSGWMEEPHHLRGSQPAESVTDLSNQPLNFAPHFNRDPEVHVQPKYTHASGGPVRGGDPPSNYAWAPSSAPGAAYPSVPPTMPSGPQVDHPIALPSPASGHSALMFPPGHGFQPTVPMIGAAFGVGAGVTPHPAAFPGDTYGVAERPKKASVPNWLREEIIKNKTVITSSAPELLKEDSQSIEDDDNNDKSPRKGNQADSKSIESSRSTEDEDEEEDEDEVEVARTAAINKEIKRVLTEVLLKVTDELFDEIATKVLKEDDLSVEVGQDIDLSNQKMLPSAPAVLTPKASAKILIPTKMKERDNDDASEKSTSGAPGDLLGLGNYASDEEDEEIQSSGKPNSKASSTHPQSSSNNLLEGNPDIENGGSPERTEQRNVPAKLETSASDRKSPVGAISDRSVSVMESNDNLKAKVLISTDNHHSSKKVMGILENELQYGSDSSKLSSSLIEKAVERHERPDGNLNNKSTRDRSDKNDGLENKRNLVKKDRRDSESSKERVDKKGDEEHRRREERRARTERIDNHDNSKEKGKEKGRTDEKVKNSESRKRPSPSDGKEGGTTETHRDKRTHRKDNDEKAKDRADEKRERSRHKSGSESSRYKRRRSSSIGARDRDSKDNVVAGRANDSSDESSDDSKRKSHHSKRRNSPSPRPRKRQVSRSPHSKHSKRRHSPYSSLENTRGRRSPSSSRSRSRSRSPVHRRR
ncbi:hypothetical protein ACS0TY_010199 [Phlomoides rotata]